MLQPFSNQHCRLLTFFNHFFLDGSYSDALIKPMFECILRKFPKNNTHLIQPLPPTPFNEEWIKQKLSLSAKTSQNVEMSGKRMMWFKAKCLKWKFGFFIVISSLSNQFPFPNLLFYFGSFLWQRIIALSDINWFMVFISFWIILIDEWNIIGCR